MNDTTNARIRQLADGITAEMIAEQTHLFYEPHTGGGTIAFQSRESLFLNGAYQPLSGNFDILSVGIPDIAGRCFGSGVDPVTGADLANVSAAGVALIIKAAYDVLYNERADKRSREAHAPDA